MTETEIEGVKFKFVHVKGRQGIRLSTLVIKLVGPIMAGGTPDASALIGALATAEADDILAMADMLGPVSQMEFEPGKWTHLTASAQDEHFAGRTKLFYSWLVHCVKDQFPDFFV